MAQICVGAVEQTENLSIPLGGPEALTREGIVRLAFAAAGTKPRILHLPRWAPIACAYLLRPLHPRLAEVTDFTARALTADFLAPPAGIERLGDYFGTAPMATTEHPAFRPPPRVGRGRPARTGSRQTSSAAPG